jgi:hypothetical protein
MGIISFTIKSAINLCILLIVLILGILIGASNSDLVDIIKEEIKKSYFDSDKIDLKKNETDNKIKNIIYSIMNYYLNESKQK